MTRAFVQLSRFARVLRPRAILLDLHSEGAGDAIRELRAEEELARIPLLVFARDAGATPHPGVDALAPAADADLVSFVEKVR
jgi:hypothetical protein